MIWTAGGKKRAEEGLREGARKQGETSREVSGDHHPEEGIGQ